jgi:hypothetical protein
VGLLSFPSLVNLMHNAQGETDRDYDQPGHQNDGTPNRRGLAVREACATNAEDPAHGDQEDSTDEHDGPTLGHTAQTATGS